jgi:plastocyanin
MKIKYLIGIIMICLLVFVNGCSKGDDSDNLVDDLNEISGSAVEDGVQDSEAESQDSDSNEQDVVVIEYDDKTNAELVAELMQDLVDEDNAEEESSDEEAYDEEVVVNEPKEIILEYFRGDPKDVTIDVGTTVRWTNMMHFNHIIIILPKRKDDNTYENRWINEDLEQIWYDESYEYTFNEVGNYKWGSKTKFDITNGKIVVVASS